MQNNLTKKYLGDIISSMFIETNGRIDTLIKIFAYYPDKSLRYVVKRKGRILARFLIMQGGKTPVKTL